MSRKSRSDILKEYVLVLANEGKLTLKAIADQMDIPYSTVKRWCNGIDVNPLKGLKESVIALANEGKLSKKQIAQVTGASYATVKAWTVGVKLDPVLQFRDPVLALTKEGKLNRHQIAKKVGVSYYQVLKWTKHLPDKIKDSSKDIVIALANEGFTRHEIAEKTGLSLTIVKTYAKGLALSRPPRVYPRELKQSVIALANEGKLTRKEIAEKTGVRYKTVAMWTQGLPVKPDVRVIKRDDRVFHPNPKATVPKLPDAPRFKSIKTSTPPPPPAKVSIPIRVVTAPVNSLFSKELMGLGRLTALMAPPGVREAIKCFLVDNFIGGGVDSAWNESKLNGPKRIRVKISNSKSKLIADSDGEPITLNFDTEGHFLGYDRSASTQQKKPLLYNSAMSL